MDKNWKILRPNEAEVRKIRDTLNCSPVTAAILVNRNIVSEKDAFVFFNASIADIRPPFAIKDMDIAVRRIHTAVIRREKILIFGDYDVDGITSAAVLSEFLTYIGADVSCYIPHRVKEGYSLQTGHIRNYAAAKGINLIITVDCGSKSHDAVSLAKAAGIDVIISDHHAIDGSMPEAVAVVNPKREDCKAGFDNLAGVGVVFCLLICLRKYLRDMNFWQNMPEPNLKKFCDLVALGTVADVVPLTAENRILSKIGLELINSGERTGIRALVKACGIGENSPAISDDIAFRLAPRLNAAGRVDHALTALSLLTTDDMETARRFARTLNLMNQQRQSLEREIFEEILEYLKQNPDILRQYSLVLSDPGWHEGILGIVASKIVERYYRPVILIGTGNGMGKGSGRSIPGIDINAGLVACEKDLEFFGGHAMAAGLTIKTDNIPRFRKNFENVIRNTTGLQRFLREIPIDYEIGFDEISDELTDELKSLEPFGEGNPEPLFMARNIMVSSSKIVGENHRRMILRQAEGRNGRAVNAIQFNIDRDRPLKDRFDRMAFRLRRNHWNGKSTLQIIVEET